MQSLGEASGLVDAALSTARFATGGGGDVVARILAHELTKSG